MTTPDATSAKDRPRLDPYELGRALALALRSARGALEAALHRPAADTSIDWEDGEAGRDDRAA
jgi:hypothetical protein